MFFLGFQDRFRKMMPKGEKEIHLFFSSASFFFFFPSDSRPINLEWKTLRAKLHSCLGSWWAGVMAKAMHIRLEWPHGLYLGPPWAVTERESLSPTLRSRRNFRDLALQLSWEMFYRSRCVPLWGWVCLVKTIPGPPGCRSEPSGPSGCCKPWFPDTRSQTGHTYDLDA